MDNMTTSKGSLTIPLLGAASNMTTTALKEGSSLLKHRREHPITLPTKSSSAHVTTLGLFNNVQPHTDNRDMSTDSESKSTLLEDLAKGAAIGIGVGVGLAGTLWLINKMSKQKETSQMQRPIVFAVPASFERGGFVEEEEMVEEEGEAVQSLEEEEEVLTTLM